MSEELPKQDLLIKILGMTTSENDNQALVAIRKANALLRDNGWDWEKLIQGKIRIIEDPFKSVPSPSPQTGGGNVGPAYAPNRPRPAADPYATTRRPQGTTPSNPARPKPGTWAPSPPPPPPQAPAADPASWGANPNFATAAKAAPHHKHYLATNKWANGCYCCGQYVAAGAGAVFKPGNFNAKAKVKPEVICTKCDTDKSISVPDYPHPKRHTHTANLHDII